MHIQEIELISRKVRKEPSILEPPISRKDHLAVQRWHVPESIPIQVQVIGETNEDQGVVDVLLLH